MLHLLRSTVTRLLSAASPLPLFPFWLSPAYIIRVSTTHDNTEVIRSAPCTGGQGGGCTGGQGVGCAGGQGVGCTLACPPLSRAAPVSAGLGIHIHVREISEVRPNPGLQASSPSKLQHQLGVCPCRCLRVPTNLLYSLTSCSIRRIGIQSQVCQQHTLTV